MKKGIFVVCVAVLVLAMVMAAAAKVETPKKVEPLNGGGQSDDKGSQSQGQPFLEIWKAIKDLQDKLNSGVTRAEFDKLKERVEDLEGRVEALEARVAFLEQCVPVSESCNGMDDDCNGAVDDDLTAPTQSCTVGTGACQNTGTQAKTCLGVNGWSDWGVCSVSPGNPTAETCNGIDDDCDGFTDEDSNLCGSGEVCSGGECKSTSCSPACAADQVCETGQCKYTCAGIFHCYATNGCSQFGDPTCEASCVAQGSTEEQENYNAFDACKLETCPTFEPECVLPDCNNLYPTCIG